MDLHLLQLVDIPVLQQLQIEEALLRADQRNWCIINKGSPPAIVMGISGQPAALINATLFNQSPVPLIKRFSGGGTVFIDENTLFVTFIFNSHVLTIPPFPEPIMRWTESFYRPLFQPHPFALRENDYVMNEKKFGGNAQSIVKNRWLHHSSLLWKFHPKNMDYLLLPPKMPHYRATRSHSDFLCELSDFLYMNQFEEQLTCQLKKQFEIFHVAKESIDGIIELPHRKATQLINF